MLTVKGRKGRSKLDNISKSFESLSKETVSFGHYQNQGNHYSGMSYPDLMKGWASGWDGTKFNGIVKNPRAIAINNIDVWSKSPELRKAFKEWNMKVSRRRGTTPLPPNELLKDFGIYLREKYRSLFGEVARPYMPYVVASDNDTPLLETGDLKAHVAYRTSIGNKVNTK